MLQFLAVTCRDGGTGAATMMVAEVLAENVEIIRSSESFLLFLLKSVSRPDSALLTWMVLSSQAKCSCG